MLGARYIDPPCWTTDDRSSPAAHSSSPSPPLVDDWYRDESANAASPAPAGATDRSYGRKPLVQMRQNRKPRGATEMSDFLEQRKGGDA